MQTIANALDGQSGQPGMEWIDQLKAKEASGELKVNWEGVPLEYRQWAQDQSGLTEVGGAIVTAVVAYFTAGAASNIGALAGEAAASSVAGGTVATLGEGAFIAAGGVTTSTVVSGAVTAGIMALASQTAVSLINNNGDLGKVLQELGSSTSIKNLVTAMATGGALAGLNLNPTGGATLGQGADGFFNTLSTNLQAAGATAVIDTALNGGSLGDRLEDTLKSALINAAAATGANFIGDITGDDKLLNTFTNKVAHAIAGCAAGAAKAGNSGACGAGALGAVIGEITAEVYGRNTNTVQLSGLMASLGVAVAGGTAEDIAIANATGQNAAANNYLTHDQWTQLAEKLQSCKTAAECERIRQEYAALSARQDAEMREACKDLGSAACRGHVQSALEGRKTQEKLVLVDRVLPEMYVGGNDFNASARVAALNVLSHEIQQLCRTNPICATKNQDALTAVASVVLDFVPVIGDVKGFVEAETPFDYLLASIGTVGPVGDGLSAVLKEGAILYKAGSIGAALDKLREASRMSVNGMLGATPSASGLLNKTKLGEAATVPTNTFDQRLMISDVVANGDKLGEKTEALVHKVLDADNGITVLPGTKYHGNNGLDHVVQYVDPDTGKTMTMVIDSKQLAINGTTKLDPVAAGSADAGVNLMQLSDASLEVIADRLDPSSSAKVALDQALKNGTLIKAVAYVDKSTGELKIIRVNV